MTENSQCLSCKHYKGMKEGVFSCDAFKDIPYEIVFNEVDHSKPYDGDNNIQYELNPEMEILKVSFED